MTPPMVRAALAGRRRWYVLGAALLVVAAVATWAVWPSSVTVHGSMVLGPTQFQVTQGPDPKACVADGGYTDVREGAGVVVTNDAGATVGVGSLGAGRLLGEGGCTFRFSVKVPAGARFYGVEVAHRGKVTYPADKLKAAVRMGIG